MQTQILRDAVIEVNEASEEDLELMVEAIDKYDNYEQAALYCQRKINNRFGDYVEAWEYYRRNKIKEGLYAIFRHKLIRD